MLDYCLVPENGSQCEFVRNHSGLCEGGGFFRYSEFVFCQSSAWFGLAVAVCIFALSQLFLALSIAADSFLCSSLAVIVDQLKISQNIAGVTFLAFGNGAPDIFSAIASVLSAEEPKPGLALGALLGAGIFVTTVIVATVTLIRPFDLMRRPLLRDLFFFLIAVGWTFYILFNHRITSLDSLGFIALYVIYCAVVVIGRYLRKKRGVTVVLSEGTTVGEAENAENSAENNEAVEGERKLGRVDSVVEEAQWQYDQFRRHADDVRLIQDQSDLEADTVCNWLRAFITEIWACLKPSSDKWASESCWSRLSIIITFPLTVLLKLTIPRVSLESEADSWCQPLAVVHCVLCPVLALVAIKKQSCWLGGVVPLWSVSLVASSLLVLVVLVFTRRHRTPGFFKWVAYAGFGMAVLWIYGLAREVVGLVTTFGVLTGVSHDLLGLTLLAWSNSLGDLISDVAVAKQGYSRMAISACFGGPLFNLLLGVGIPFSIVSLRRDSGLQVVFSGVRKLLVGFLAYSLLSSLILIPTSRFRATRFYAVYLLSVYIVFLIAIILTEKRIIDWF